MTENERSAIYDFKTKLLELDKQTLSFFTEIFSTINCNKHDTPCEKCPLYLGGNCILFLFEVEKYGRLAERR